jgi:hypothetical protein
VHDGQEQDGTGYGNGMHGRNMMDGHLPCLLVLTITAAIENQQLTARLTVNHYLEAIVYIPYFLFHSLIKKG